MRNLIVRLPCLLIFLPDVLEASGIVIACITLINCATVITHSVLVLERELGDTYPISTV